MVSAVVFVLVVAAVAVAGSIAGSSSGDQYASIVRPAWAPPPWLFGPVWTVLYAAIAVAGWRVYWIAGAGSLRAVRPEMLVYAIGLVLNALWTPLFFAAQARTAALVDIVLLDLVIVATLVLFMRRDRIAGFLFVPYFLWTAFATALNLSIVLLN
ncbi:tryptophan-rich sensory protein [Saccharopolyspora rhizosphaerae]|uniref:Tryptophan-rich sensory protein n=1 Tax=Saccharopolyspora rhizosphaerae TaxID=2492662 RepID=A0A426JZV5_9PSEU|nr:tryptophan-rich sensory protein [Saccharopolyspora rhizosphaerae]